MPKPRKPFLKKILSFRWLLVLNILVLVILAVSFGREFVRNFEIQREINDLQMQEEELMAKNLQITKLNTAFQTESFIEREARLKLGMKKPGENVVVIKRDEGSQTSEDDMAEADDPLNILTEKENPYRDLANPGKWWYYFFDRTRFNDLQNYE